MKDSEINIVTVTVDPGENVSDIADQVNKEFAEHGYPNLCVDMSDFYDGLWTIRNKRTNGTIHTYCHDGSIIFFPHCGSDNTYVIYFSSKAEPSDEELKELIESSDGYYEEVQAVSSNNVSFEKMSTPKFFEQKVKDWWDNHPAKADDLPDEEHAKCELAVLEKIISRLLNDRQDLERKIIQMELWNEAKNDR